VLYLGKPHGPVYGFVDDRLREVVGREVPRAKWLAIGDDLKTDIAGAREAGIDALLITGGIHEPELSGGEGAPDPSKIAAVLKDRGLRAVGAMRRLVW
jgi:ribonucleotide monophosphatase NagD (HAD superfamily)